MDERKIRLAAGSLLHDIGKLLYRYDDSRNHSISGYDFLHENNLVDDEEILNCVKYHHAHQLKSAGVANNAICYITYIADNIAAFSDRRKNETGDGGFIRNISYQSIFNILNNNSGKSGYSPSMLTDDDDVNYPGEKEVAYTEDFYGEVVAAIKKALNGIEYSVGFINSLLGVFESCTSFIPSSTQMGELRDISLYDHVKVTAALALCIYDYLNDKKAEDLKTEVYLNAEKFYNEKAFLIYSADISGIQNFIYNISSKGALKGLRSRSFYLDIVMESAIDTLLERLELTRCNVIYAGGGHTYLMLANTEKTKSELKRYELELNKWFLEYFGTELYIGGGYIECTANSFRNIPDGSYGNIFSEISKQISSKKLRRYTAQEISSLNSHSMGDNERECPICKRSDRLIQDGDKQICEICSGLKELSDSIICGSFFTVVNYKSKKSVPLPFNNYLISDSEESLLQKMKTDTGYVRSYAKNRMYTGSYLATELWVGDYSSEKLMENFAEKSDGIKRLGVLRADVDNLGQAFVGGFAKDKVTLSRTSEFSKKLSLFFKHHINSILRNGVFSLYDEKTGKRNAAIIYSGGDDVFVVGGWDDIIGFAVDLHNSFEKFTQGTLKLSAGIGVFPNKYPIYAMADETGELEEISKHNHGKNSVTLFDENNCYTWDEFINKVIGEKLKTLRTYLNVNDEKGKAMLYNMLDLIRNREKEDRLNIARFAYLLARLVPDEKETTEKKEAYRIFMSRMYNWVQNEEDSRQLITAIYLYVYMYRERNDENGE